MHVSVKLKDLIVIGVYYKPSLELDEMISRELVVVGLISHDWGLGENVMWVFSGRKWPAVVNWLGGRGRQRLTF